LFEPQVCQSGKDQEGGARYWAAKWQQNNPYPQI